MDRHEYAKHRQVIVDLIGTVDHANQNRDIAVAASAAAAAKDTSQALRNLLNSDIQKLGQ